jgi:hypothetical protein
METIKQFQKQWNAAEGFSQFVETKQYNVARRSDGSFYALLRNLQTGETLRTRDIPEWLGKAASLFSTDYILYSALGENADRTVPETF